MTAPDLSILSPREHEVVDMILAGKTRRQIRDELRLHMDVVTTHANRARKKLEEANVEVDWPPGAFLRHRTSDDAVDSTIPGCAKCGLRGEHECVPTVTERAADRRYDGRFGR